jgi:PKD repeat protein/glucose/arabinose dehydrogenase
MRLATRAVCLALAGAALLLPAGAGAVGQQRQAGQAPVEFKVLVLTEGNANIGGAVSVLQRLGQQSTPKFNVDQVKNSANGFTARHLSKYNAVVFLNNGAGEVLDDEEKAAFEAFFRAGGGFVGIGSAIETSPSWQFLTDILGTRSSGKLDSQPATIKVADRVHDASKNLPEYWNWTDSYYNFAANVRGLSHVLATVVEQPFTKTGDGPTTTGIAGGSMGFDHPVTWCKDYQGGRSFYTNTGTSGAQFNDANLQKLLAGALTWAAGQANPTYSDCGATVRANYQQSFVAAQPNLSEPIGFDVLPDGTGRVIQTDRRGGVRLHDPRTNSSTLIANIPVYIANEDGMYGPEVDNNFTQNKWVYLYYSPPTVQDVKFADGTLHTVTTPLNDPATPANEQNAPNFAASLSAWDLYNGYFQLSRFKFVDATASEPAHLDLASEQQILRVSNNRGACCHVAGDIDFDSKNNLWMVTGDDTPAGGGNSGGFGPFNGQLTNESQTVAVAGATGGTFTLTFDGQTTAPIAFPLDNAAIEAALEALSNLDDVAVTGTGTRTVNFRGNVAETNVPLMTGNGSGLTGTAPTLTVAMATGNNGQGIQVPLEGGLFNAPFVDARRSAQNTGDLRGKLLRITVKSGDITPAEANTLGGAYTVPAGNLYPPGTARTRPEIYAMGFRNPFRVTLDKFDVAYVSDYSPDSNIPQQFRGPAGTGRFEIVRKPANYGWPLCYKTDLPYYKWDFNSSTPLPSAAAPQVNECDNPTRGPQNTSRWVANGGPTVEPGLEFGPPITNPEIWYSYRDNSAAPNGPQGTPCFGYYGPGAPTSPVGACPQLFPELFTGGVGPHGTAPYNYDPVNPNPTKFPPYWDGAWIAGEFTQDTIREIRMDSQNRVFKINNTLPCGPVPATPTRPWLCDNPMDMEFGPDGTFYLLTYGDGFFNINPDAGMMRWEYVKGLRAPLAVLTADKTNGPVPLTVNFSSAGSSDADPGDSIRFEWDFDGNGTVDSVEPNPSFTYTTPGRYTAKLTVIDSSGKTGGANTIITAGNTAPTVTITVPVDGGTFAFGENIPFTVTVTDPQDGAINCSRVQVTFILGHDTHGHAEASTTGCTGVLPTEAADVSHGGNVFGVISASYTDLGGALELTTVAQNQIRQKRQEVENVLNQSGTNTAPSTDVGGGLQRGSLSAGDWMELNGPFNLLNINSITFRVTGGTNGAPSGTVEVWRDAINAAGGGTLVSTQTITGTAAGTYASQTFPITNPGGAHRLFLVFPNANTYSLNWVEFVGAGVGT